VAGFALIAAVSACDGESVGAQLAPVDAATVAGVVTDAAAESLGEDGRFDVGAGGGSGEITEARARLLANLWPLQFGPSVLSALERARGGSIDLAALRDCGRAFYARSSFRPLPSEVPAPYHRMFGGWWMVPLCGRSGDIEVALAVSALATDVDVRDGRIVLPAVGGVWFEWVGVPPGSADALSLSPEVAAVAAARLTGRRVSRVPELIAPHFRDASLFTPRWRVRLDGRASVKEVRTGRVRETHDVYVRVRRRGDAVVATEHAAGTQPDAVALRYRTAPPVGSANPVFEYREIRVERDPDVPLAYEESGAVTGGR
jgi:hypothetical protein